MLMTACSPYYGMDVEWSEYTFMVTMPSPFQKEYIKKLPGPLLFLPINKKIIKNIFFIFFIFRFDYWSGYAGSFDTALASQPGYEYDMHGHYLIISSITIVRNNFQKK